MPNMKKTILSFALAIVTVSFLSGCVAIPPLIQVQHKDADGTAQKLDSIEKRLERLEQKLDKGDKK